MKTLSHVAVTSKHPVNPVILSKKYPTLGKDSPKGKQVSSQILRAFTKVSRKGAKVQRRKDSKINLT